MGLSREYRRFLFIPMAYMCLTIFMGLGLTDKGLSASFNPNWKNAPSTPEWKAFFALSETDRARVWDTVEANRLALSDLAWQWRLAWVRTCTQSKAPSCGRVLQYGLFDKALVVRAEAAERIGQRFAGTGQAAPIRLLKTAYAIQQNSRAKEPMYVQYRILSALNQIGGEGRKIGKGLASQTASTQQYWTRLRTTQ